jgi:uncharacterized protein YukE
MRFAMGAETLSQLTTATSAASDDLGALVRELLVAAEPLQGRFNGAGRAAFDQFKAHTDEIADELDAALTSVLGGIDGQNVAFVQGEQQMVEETRAGHAGAGFESARFASYAR